MNYLAAAAFLSLGTALTGCTMFSTWKSIPPPGGCDLCHTLPISSNWKVSYEPPMLRDERDRLYFQTPEYNLKMKGKQESPLESKKVEELVCFECHNSPTPAHKERKGRFHH